MVNILAAATLDDNFAVVEPLQLNCGNIKKDKNIQETKDELTGIHFFYLFYLRDLSMT